MNRRPGDAANRVASALRDAIRKGEITAGEQLRQDDWAKRLGVSRVPVREALKTLLSEQLVSHDLRRGYFVAKVDPLEMAQVYLQRRAVEVEVLDTVEWPDATALAAIRELAKQHARAFRGRDFDNMLDISRAIHFAIYDLSPLELLAAEARRLWDLCDAHRRTRAVSEAMADPDGTAYEDLFVALTNALEEHDRPKLVAVILSWRKRTLQYYVYSAEPGPARDALVRRINAPPATARKR